MLRWKSERSSEKKTLWWWLIKTIGQLMAMGREIGELEYLWRVPHRISGDKLRATIGDIPCTSLDVAMARALRDLGAIA